MANRLLRRTTLLTVGLLVTAACEWPTQPTPPGTDVTIDVTNTNTADGGTATGGDGTGAGGEGGTGGDGGEGTPTGDGSDTAPPGPASITESSMTDDGAALYQIGPGQVFARTGGDAATVWCRPASDCNGEGGNRTARWGRRSRSRWTA